MKRLAACALAAVCLDAYAADVSFQVGQVFSNADGTVQFVQLRESAGQNGQQGLAGKTLTVTRDGRSKIFTFPSDLPSSNTANRSVLIVTPGFLAVPARYPEFKAVTPDYVAFDQLLPAEGATIDFAGTDQWTFGALPRTDSRRCSARATRSATTRCRTSAARRSACRSCRSPHSSSTTRRSITTS